MMAAGIRTYSRNKRSQGATGEANKNPTIDGSGEQVLDLGVEILTDSNLYVREANDEFVAEFESYMVQCFSGADAVKIEPEVGGGAAGTVDCPTRDDQKLLSGDWNVSIKLEPPDEPDFHKDGDQSREAEQSNPSERIRHNKECAGQSARLLITDQHWDLRVRKIKVEPPDESEAVIGEVSQLGFQLRRLRSRQTSQRNLKSGDKSCPAAKRRSLAKISGLKIERITCAPDIKVESDAIGGTDIPSGGTIVGNSSVTNHSHQFPDTQSFDCRLCEFVSGSQTALTEHFCSSHPGSTILECAVDRCTHWTDEQPNMEAHCASHTDVDEPCEQQEWRVSCDLCPGVFFGQEALITHMSDEHDVSSRRCPWCEFISGSRGALVEHVSTDHLDKTVFQCDICYYWSASPSHLMVHRRIRHAPGFPCTVCKLVFVRQIDLDRHAAECGTSGGSRRHKSRVELVKQSDGRHQRSAFSCPLCDVQFRGSVSLALHVANVHPNRTLYSCKTCSFCCLTPGQMDDHCRIRKHRPQKSHCDLCQLWPILRRSIRATCSNKPCNLRCTMCPQTAKSQLQLVKHLEAAHRIFAEGCPFCNSVAILKKTLLAHVIDVHPDKPIFDCPDSLCFFQAVTKYRLYLHRSEHLVEEAALALRCEPCKKKLLKRTSGDRRTVQRYQLKILSNRLADSARAEQVSITTDSESPDHHQKDSESPSHHVVEVAEGLPSQIDEPPSSGLITRSNHVAQNEVIAQVNLLDKLEASYPHQVINTAATQSSLVAELKEGGGFGKRMLRCSMCPQNVSSESELQDHLAKQHHHHHHYCTLPPLTSVVARASFAFTKPLLLRVPKCYLCQGTMDSQLELVEHLKEVHDKVVHCCEFCPILFNAEEMLARHVARTHANATFVKKIVTKESQMFDSNLVERGTLPTPDIGPD